MSPVGRYAGDMLMLKMFASWRGDQGKTEIFTAGVYPPIPSVRRWRCASSGASALCHSLYGIGKWDSIGKASQ